MIAVAVAVIIGVVAVTCGIVADSNHPDSLAFLGVMVRTTAAQIFLAGAICTWALFAALWLLSAGIRRSRERGIELKALRAAAAGEPVPTTAAGHGDPHTHPHEDPYGGTRIIGTSDFATSATGDPAHGPDLAGGWLGTSDWEQQSSERRGSANSPKNSPDEGPSDGSRTRDSRETSRETQPDWFVSPHLPTASTGWPSHDTPSASSEAATSRMPSPPDFWAPSHLPGPDGETAGFESVTGKVVPPDAPSTGYPAFPIGTEPDVFGFPNSMPGAGFSSSMFLDFDPLRPAAFASSPPSFDQFTSDVVPSAADLLGSGHPASDPGETVPPRSGSTGPALSDGTSPAAGLDGVDPRRARKPIGE